MFIVPKMAHISKGCVLFAGEVGLAGVAGV